MKNLVNNNQYHKFPKEQVRNWRLKLGQKGAKLKMSRKDQKQKLYQFNKFYGHD